MNTATREESEDVKKPDVPVSAAQAKQQRLREQNRLRNQRYRDRKAGRIPRVAGKPCGRPEINDIKSPSSKIEETRMKERIRKRRYRALKRQQKEAREAAAKALLTIGVSADNDQSSQQPSQTGAPSPTISAAKGPALAAAHQQPREALSCGWSGSNAGHAALAGQDNLLRGMLLCKGTAANSEKSPDATFSLETSLIETISSSSHWRRVASAALHQYQYLKSLKVEAQQPGTENRR